MLILPEYDGSLVTDEPDELAELEAGGPSYTRSWGSRDFRPGSLNEVRRKCGKPNCACAAPEHPGHGPLWTRSRKAHARTPTVHLRPGPELEKVSREMAQHERFRDRWGRSWR